MLPTLKNVAEGVHLESPLLLVVDLRSQNSGSFNRNRWLFSEFAAVRSCGASARGQPCWCHHGSTARAEQV